MPTTPLISGFAMVRNAIALEYPFRESILSVLPLVDELILNVGVSTDGTEKVCEDLVRESGGKVRLLSSEWNLKGLSGNELARQTDIALNECRGRWCLYIQADEVLHEGDYGLLREAMLRADRREEVDALLFDYVHFYGNYDYVMKARNWYRREVRLFKNGRGIQSFRDAQGFRGPKESKVRAIQSGARVFHYGHVRTLQSLREKARSMAPLWGETPEHSEERLLPRRLVGMERFVGSHPAIMTERLKENGLYVDPSTRKGRWTRRELKNLLTLWWEKLAHVRIGEFKNYVEA